MNLDLMVYILEIIYQIKLKKEAYIINIDKYENTGTHWVSLFVKANKVGFLCLLKQVYLEDKHTIQLCVDIFV